MSGTDEETWLRAGEYVLGLLDAGELAQVARDAQTDDGLANAIGFWERRLSPLTAFVPSVAPPDWLYARIEARLAARAAAPATAGIVPFKPRSTVRWWQAIAVASMAAAAGMAFVLLQSVPPALPPVSPTQPPEVLAVILPQPGVEAGTGWVALKSADGAVHVTAFGKIGQAPNKYLELWFVPKGGAPVAVGHIPTTAKDSRFALSAPLNSVAALAVSQEPSDQPLKGPTDIRYVGAVLD